MVCVFFFHKIFQRMLSNLILNERKCILFIDEIGIDTHAERIMSNLFHEINDNNYTIYPKTELESLNLEESQSKHNIIFRPITQLLIDHKLSTILTEIKLMLINDGNHIGRILLWITANKIPEDFITHFFEYIADIIVTFRDATNLSVLSKKSSGDSSFRTYNYGLVRNSTGNEVIIVKEIKKVKTKATEPITNPEEVGTFKIKLEEEEMIARNALQLPYEKVRDASTDTKKTDSQIIYSPELDDDDYDDEDPDDDLDI